MAETFVHVVLGILTTLAGVVFSLAMRHVNEKIVDLRRELENAHELTRSEFYRRLDETRTDYNRRLDEAGEHTSKLATRVQSLMDTRHGITRAEYDAMRDRVTRLEERSRSHGPPAGSL